MLYIDRFRGPTYLESQNRVSSICHRSLKSCEGSSPIFGYLTYGDADMEERLKQPRTFTLSRVHGRRAGGVYGNEMCAIKNIPACRLSRYETMHVERSQGLIMFRALF